jgi:dimethylaniline monooxygenase (N-oxide forming)
MRRGALFIGSSVIAFVALNVVTNVPAHSEERQNPKKRRKVAVIGAGVSGLVTTKCLLDEGHHVTTFEKANDIGGNWTYHPPLGATIEQPIDEHSSCYSNLYTITLNSQMALADFPLIAKGPKFPHHSLVNRFLNAYCDHFHLRQYIKLNSSVVQVAPANGSRWLQSNLHHRRVHA